MGAFKDYSGKCNKIQLLPPCLSKTDNIESSKAPYLSFVCVFGRGQDLWTVDLGFTSHFKRLGVPTVAHSVKDLTTMAWFDLSPDSVGSRIQCRLQLQLGFSPRPGNFHMPQVQP